MLWKRAWIPRRSRSQGGATEQGAMAEQGTRAEEAELKTTKVALKTKVEPAELNTLVEPVELMNTVQLVELETTVGLVEQWLSGYDRGHREFSYGLLLSPKGRQSSEMASVAIIGQVEGSEMAFLTVN